MKSIKAIGSICALIVGLSLLPVRKDVVTKHSFYVTNVKHTKHMVSYEVGENIVAKTILDQNHWRTTAPKHTLELENLADGDLVKEYSAWYKPIASLLYERFVEYPPVGIYRSKTTIVNNPQRK